MSDLITVQRLADEALTSSNTFKQALGGISLPTGTADITQRIEEAQKQLDELTALLTKLKGEKETFTRQSAAARKLGGDASAAAKRAKEAGLAYDGSVGSVDQAPSSHGAA